MKHFRAPIIANEHGSVMVVALLAVIMLSIVGFAASRTTRTENLTLRNVFMDKQDFYITDGSIYTVARNVDQAVSGYEVVDINTSLILTTVTGASTQGSLSDADWQDILDEFDDTAWPVVNSGTAKEYSFRAVYRGQGLMPKGYGPKFGAYMFEITSRKQETSGGTTDFSTVIDTGHRKIGPKTT
jgi:hypothetical protein